MNPSRKIAVFGAGHVGGALGKLWAAKGHQVVYATRSSELSNSQAASRSEIVALALPWESAEEAVRGAGDLSGKILIDCMNPLAPDLKSLTVGRTSSAAEQVATWAPQAKVVKAFNTIGAANYGNARFGELQADGFYCGDDAGAKEIVKPLIEDIGLDPVDVGPLVNARALEAMALLWIDLAVIQRQGANHAFKLLRR